MATYESASTRRFLLGRVDCIRSASTEALEWVKAMCQDEGANVTLESDREEEEDSRKVKFSIYSVSCLLSSFFQKYIFLNSPTLAERSLARTIPLCCGSPNGSYGAKYFRSWR